jgi:hypothetical protein
MADAARQVLVMVWHPIGFVTLVHIWWIASISNIQQEVGFLSSKNSHFFSL